MPGTRRVYHQRNEKGKQFLESNKMKTQPTRNDGVSKVSVNGKIYNLNATIKNMDILQIYYLMLHLKLLEKLEQAKPKTSRDNLKEMKSMKKWK
jgi:hypothetical protein